MKILLIGTSVVSLGSSRYGGVEKLCWDMAGALAKQHEVSVAAPIGSRVPEGVELVETVELPKEQDRDDLALMKIYQKTEFKGFDIAHDFSHGQMLGRIGLKLPVIYHNWNPITVKYVKSDYNAVCVSEWQAKRYEAAYNRKTVVMPMWVDEQTFKPVNKPRRERFLFLGKLSAEKGAHLAIGWCKEIGVELDVVGGLIASDSRDYAHEIERRCDGKQIRFKWNVTEAEKIDYLQNARAVVYPVQQEEANWLVGWEAWCCGTLTVVLDKGAMREISAPNGVAKTKEEFLDIMRSGRYQNDWRGWSKLCWLSEVVIQFTNLYSEVGRGARW